eukprot:1606583-Pleurochrysis_carterae.AAC.1
MFSTAEYSSSASPLDFADRAKDQTDDVPLTWANSITVHSSTPYGSIGKATATALAVGPVTVEMEKHVVRPVPLIKRACT